MESMNHWVTYTCKRTDSMLRAARRQDDCSDRTLAERLSDVPVITRENVSVRVPLGEDVYSYVLDAISRRGDTVLEIIEIDRIPVTEGAGQVFF